MRKHWTEEMDAAFRVIALEKNADTGSPLSYSQIASRLNERFGTALSRSSCIARARRIGLDKQDFFIPKKKRKRPYTPRQRVSRPPLPLATRHVDVDPLLIALPELAPCMCRYPYGEKEYLFCGRPARAGSSYCDEHHFLCWEPAESRARRVAEAA